MRFKHKVECEECGNPYHRMRERRGRILCYPCWTKEVIIIRYSGEIKVSEADVREIQNIIGYKKK